MSATATSVPRRRRTAWYFFLLALASLMWAAQGTAVKILDRSMGPIAITFVPFYITTLLFVPLLLTSKANNHSSRRPSASDWVKFTIAGVAGQVLAQLGMTWGISRSLASNGAILNLLIPVISAVLASLMLKERLTLLRIASLLIGLIGVVLMSVSDWRQASFGQMHFLLGNVLILGGCLGSSFYNVYCKGLMQRFSEIEILIFSYITASLASLPLLIWVEPFSFRTFLQFDWQSWAAFAFLALFMYGASMLLFFKVLQHLDVTTASASLYLVPVFGVFLAAVLLGERLNVISIAGAVVVLAATLLIMRYDTSY
ncbi:MAG TPA: DMT family transporter [Silvibacterium sp.]|jgi:drug/metabolite transporter (DMT)-like permease|nr:DMT family transporter [Silvibacterium sp.]